MFILCVDHSIYTWFYLHLTLLFTGFSDFCQTFVIFTFSVCEFLVTFCVLN